MPAFLSLTLPTPLEYFASLVADDDHLPLVEAAVSIAQDECPAFDIDAVMADLDAQTQKLKRRVPADAAAVQRLRLLNQFFFRELGFAGNANDYYAPSNSYLHLVLATRRGIPLTLALIYMEFANQIGLTAWGVSFPGHFLVKLHLPQGDVVIDPFTGQSMARETLEEMAAPYQRPAVGAPFTPLGVFLQSTPAREVLARLLRNLKEIYRSAGDWRRLLPVTQRLVILLPDVATERRDRGMAYAELGCEAQAVVDLSDYVAHNPLAPDAPAVSAQIARLTRFGARRLH